MYSKIFLPFPFLFMTLQLIAGMPANNGSAALYIIDFYHDVSEAAKESYANSLKEDISINNMDILRAGDEIVCVVARLTPDQVKSWKTDIVSQPRTSHALLLFSHLLYSYRSRKLIRTNEARKSSTLMTLMTMTS